MFGQVGYMLRFLGDIFSEHFSSIFVDNRTKMPLLTAAEQYFKNFIHQWCAILSVAMIA